MIRDAALLAGVFLVGIVTCRAALLLVRRLEILDVPNERSSHDRPTPRGGGIGILAALVPGLLVGAWLQPGPLDAAGVAVVVAATLVLAGLGFVDDRRGVRPGVKLVLQLAVAAGAIAAAGSVEIVALPLVGGISLGLAAPVLTVLWLVGFVNGFNFMDGIDGIAGLHAGLAGLFLAAAAWAGGGEGAVWLAIPLAGASLSFLLVNWSPAKVFMGDVGSLPLGFLLALGAVLGTPFVTGFLILGPFVFDTGWTLLRRARRGENLLTAHRSHLYQRLVLAGWSHARVSILYGGWTVLTGAMGLLYLLDAPGVRMAALMGALASGMGMVLLVHRCERIPGAGQ